MSLCRPQSWRHQSQVWQFISHLWLFTGEGCRPGRPARASLWAYPDLVGEEYSRWAFVGAEKAAQARAVAPRQRPYPTPRALASGARARVSASINTYWPCSWPSSAGCVHRDSTRRAPRSAAFARPLPRLAYKQLYFTSCRRLCRRHADLRTRRLQAREELHVCVAPHTAIRRLAGLPCRAALYAWPPRRRARPGVPLRQACRTPGGRGGFRRRAAWRSRNGASCARSRAATRRWFGRARTGMATHMYFAQATEHRAPCCDGFPAQLEHAGMKLRRMNGVGDASAKNLEWR
jgi:hypothetical protein